MKDDPTGEPIGATITTTTITTAEAKLFSYVAPARFRLLDLSVFGDANFVANAKIKVLLGGKVITGSQAAPGYIALNSATQGWTKSWANSKIYIDRGASVEIWAYTTTSTATASVDMTGEGVREV